jgi:acyl-CoA synthetase (AMP-forming)/AMP-acid ligase II
MNKEVIKSIISVIAFLSAVIIGFIAIFIPPSGIIDASVLWFTAQLLVFVSGLLGVDFQINALKQIASTSNNKEKNKEKDK